MLGRFWGANTTQDQERKGDAQLSASGLVSYLYSSKTRAKVVKNPENVKEEVENSSNLYETLIALKPNGEHETVPFNTKMISDAILRFVEFTEKAYVPPNQNCHIPQDIYKIMISGPNFAETFIGLIKHGAFKGIGFKKGYYKGLAGEFLEGILHTNQKTVASNKTVALFASSFFAKFVELCDGINTRSDSTVPMSEFIGNLQSIFKNEYHNTERILDTGIQFRESILNVLIQAYTTNKSVVGYGMFTKHGKLQDQLADAAVKDVLENSNLVVEISHGTKGNKLREIVPHSLQFPQTDNGQKAQITFLRVDTSDHTATEHQFEYKYSKERVEYLAQPGKLDKLLKLGMDLKTIYNADLYKLQLIDSPLYSFFKDVFVKKEKESQKSEKNNAKLSQSMIFSADRKKKLKNSILDFFDKADVLDIPAPMKSEKIVKFLQELLEYNGKPSQKVQSSIEKEVLDYIIQTHPSAASFIEAKYEYKSQEEYFKPSQDLSNIIDKVYQDYNYESLPKIEANEGGKPEIEVLSPPQTSTDFQVISKNGSHLSVLIMESGDIVIKNDETKAKFTLKHHAVLKYRMLREQFNYLVDSGLLEMDYIANLSPEELNMLLSPFGQLFMKCLVRNGELGHLYQNDLSVSLDAVEHMRKFLLECEGKEFSNMRQFLQKERSSKLVNIPRNANKNRCAITADAAKEMRLAVFKILIQNTQALETVVNSGYWGLDDLMWTVSPNRGNILTTLSSQATLDCIKSGKLDPNKLLDSHQMVGCVVQIMKHASASASKNINARQNLANLIVFTTECKSIARCTNSDERFTNKLDLLCSNMAFERYSHQDCKIAEIIQHNPIEGKNGAISTNNIAMVLDKLIAEINRVKVSESVAMGR